MGILKQAEGGVTVGDLCREHGISSAFVYKWRSIYGSMDAFMISHKKSLGEDNRRLKKMYAAFSMQSELLREALGNQPSALFGALTKSLNGVARLRV